MNVTRHLTLVRLAWISCLVASAACRSIPAREDRAAPPPAPSGRKATPEEELTLIRADSEVFAAVVHAQLEGGDDAYPYHLERLRYDWRPYGTASGYPEDFAGVQGIDPTLSFARVGVSAMDHLVDNRKEILQMSGAPLGVAASYAQCAGAGVPAPPPVRGSAARTRRADVHAGCPKAPEYFLTVGLPIRGQPEGLRNSRDTRGRRVSVGGDVWTVLVEEYSVAPRGWRRAQYAWLFRRSRWSGRLELASTILVGVID